MKVLIFSNLDIGLYRFRKELLRKIIDQGHSVVISLPLGQYSDKLKELGCKLIDTPVDRRGINPLKDLKLFFHYRKILKSVQPDVVKTMTIKPNIYGGLACRLAKIPYIANITGLGTAVQSGGLLKRIIVQMYKVAFKSVSAVFFENSSNMEFVRDNITSQAKLLVVPGSGVNLSDHPFEEYPVESEPLTFLFIGRVMREKGIEELFSAITTLKSEYPQVVFKLIGGCEEDYTDQLNRMEIAGLLEYLGFQDNIHQQIKNSHATILPSYHEGMANVLLETAATGRVVIASDIPGCRETFDEGSSGFGFKPKDVETLVDALRQFIQLSHQQRVEMGRKGRVKVEKEFDRQIVVDRYIKEIEAL